MTINSLNFDAQALREKILDLAMRGKLVKQDPNDEPASVLLEKIKTEKDQLVKEKKIKKTKPLAPITDEEKPFDIPDSWEWVRLGDVSDIQMGQAPKGTNVNEEGLGYEFHQGKTEFTDEIIGKSSKYTTDDKRLVSSDYILMAVRAPVGDVNLTNRPIVIGRGLAGINGLINNKKYLFYYLESAKKYFETNSTGSTFKAVNGNVVKNTPIPLPPLEEQSRIADKIAQLFALLRKVESSNDQYVELQQMLHDKVLDLAMRGKLVEQDPNDEPASVLLEKIKAERAQLIKEKKIKKSKPLPPITDEEKPFDIPDSWEWVRLGDISKFVTKGTTPKGGQSAYLPEGIKYYRAENIKQEKLLDEPIKYISEEVHDNALKRSKLEVNDILVTIAGTLGNVAIVSPKNVPGNTNQAVSITRLINSRFFNLDFLVYAIKNEMSRVIKRKKTTSIPNLTLQQISECVLPLPPLKEQNKIVVKLSKVWE